MKPYYKTSDGKVVELKQQDVSCLWSKNIVELIIPDVCKKVWCFDNQLTELIIPDGCKYVRCYDNQLTKVIIPNSCEGISCRANQLKELVIPAGCEWVWADMKSVTELNKVDRLYLYI